MQSPSPGGDDALADRILRLVFGNPESGISSLLERMLGRGLPEMDLAAAVVLRRIQRPIPLAWIPVQTYSGMPGLPSEQSMTMFWCEVQSDENKVQGFSGWPKRGGRGLEFVDGVDFFVQPTFRHFDPPRVRTTETWARQSQGWTSLLREFASAARGMNSPLKKADWLSQDSGAPARFAQVVAKARSPEAIEKLRVEWPRISSALNAAIDEQFKAAQISASADFGKSLEGFLDPFVRESGSRTALLLGRPWKEAEAAR